jgi:hypothetical protein
MTSVPNIIMTAPLIQRLLVNDKNTRLLNRNKFQSHTQENVIQNKKFTQT